MQREQARFSFVLQIIDILELIRALSFLKNLFDLEHFKYVQLAVLKKYLKKSAYTRV